MNLLLNILLRLLAAFFNQKPSLRKYLCSSDGWINFKIGFRSLEGSVSQAISFYNGRVRVLKNIPPDADIVLEARCDDYFKEMIGATPNELLNLILKNRLIINGNIAYLQLFNFYVSLLLGSYHQKVLEKKGREEKELLKSRFKIPSDSAPEELYSRKVRGLRGNRSDPGVKYLEEPYLAECTLEDFPRLKTMLGEHFSEMPQICPERTVLLTRYFRREGFEDDAAGTPRNPLLRQAEAYKYMMANRKALIAPGDLLAGTSTSKLPTGVIIYPDAQGTMIWGELNTVEKRNLNPYKVTPGDSAALHDAFTFWAKRNFREWVRAENNNPLSQKIEERWVSYFVWKSVGISHTVPDYPSLLKKGTSGIIGEIQEKLNSLTPEDEKKRAALEAMVICLEGVNVYAANLSEEAAELARVEIEGKRRRELQKIARICRRVPEQPPRNLAEAVNSIWIIWVALHMENTNTGLSPGRLDSWLQPFFESDMRKAKNNAARKACIENAIELIGCLFMRCTDHLPLVPDIGNYLFGGSSSDQAITLGGITPEGEDAVNDMTYIFLKVTEILSIRDPNVNARFHPGINSDNYLRRLCEVNYSTAATPSMHNDIAVMASLKQHNYADKHLRDWSATGCVEATLSGRHMGHTGSILFNMVSALEMALNNGTHPLMGWELGPRTGSVDSGDFKSFEAFFEAFTRQLRFLIDNAVELNNLLADTHARFRPTPLLSALIEGSIEKGLDVTAGGALYNTSGTSNIGLADVTDSLTVIKKLVFEDKKTDFPTLKKALENDFREDGYLHALITGKIPLFGSGDREALKMANRVAALVHDIFSEKRNYRGGPYTTGFWSMSQHVAYGNLSGALPSGRLSGKAFTPGLTPQPVASRVFLDNLTDVAALDHASLDNNIAFNVKIVPSPADSREKIVDTMTAYVKTYFEAGGMQMQFNVVKADTLKDAMLNPENYKNLLVRISGYNAYFVTLNREMQIELIERAEYSI